MALCEIVMKLKVIRRSPSRRWGPRTTWTKLKHQKRDSSFSFPRYHLKVRIKEWFRQGVLNLFHLRTPWVPWALFAYPFALNFIDQLTPNTILFGYPFELFVYPMGVKYLFISLIERNIIEDAHWCFNSLAIRQWSKDLKTPYPR